MGNVVIIDEDGLAIVKGLSDRDIQVQSPAGRLHRLLGCNRIIALEINESLLTRDIVMLTDEQNVDALPTTKINAYAAMLSTENIDVRGPVAFVRYRRPSSTSEPCLFSLEEQDIYNIVISYKVYKMAKQKVDSVLKAEANSGDSLNEQSLKEMLDNMF